MSGISDIAWLGIAVLVAFGMLQVLRALAITVRNETMIHDLKVGVAAVQVQQFHAEMLRHGMVAPSNSDAETGSGSDTRTDPTGSGTPDKDGIGTGAAAAEGATNSLADGSADSAGAPASGPPESARQAA